METTRDSTFFVVFLILASVFGLALIPILVLQPSIEYVQSSIRHSIVGTLYIVICLLGVLAVFYPAKCRNIFKQSQNPLPQTNKKSAAMQIIGHHPSCQNFSANRIIVGGRTVCAACGGLLIGAVIALIGAGYYFFAGLNVAGGSVWLLVLGEVWLLLGLVQIKFSGYSKAVVNAVFVVGSFLTLMETDAVGESMLVDFYVLGLIAFMLWLRILLSEWNNRRICSRCQSCFQ